MNLSALIAKHDIRILRSDYSEANMHVSHARLLMIAITWMVTVINLSSDAQAQTISTPTGELRLGMTQSEAERLFEKPVGEEREFGTTIGHLHQNADKRSYGVKLTSKGVVYDIYSVEWGSSEDAKQRFQGYLGRFGAPVVPSNPPTKSRYWKARADLAIGVSLHCDDTTVVVEMSDHGLLMRDNGIQNLKEQTMWPLGDPWCF